MALCSSTFQMGGTSETGGWSPSQPDTRQHPRSQYLRSSRSTDPLSNKSWPSTKIVVAGSIPPAPNSAPDVPSAQIISASRVIFRLTSHTEVLISRRKITYLLSRLDAAGVCNERPSCDSRGGLTRSRMVCSFDCKAMRELDTNARRGSLPYRQDYASYASSSIF